MRPFLCTLLLASIVVSATAFRTPGQGATDPERLLTERFGLSPAELDQARAAQPVAKMLATDRRDELGVVGAVRLTGDKTRLADWIRNIEHFRGAAELGTARVIPSPVTEAAFASLDSGTPDAAAIRRTLVERALAYVAQGQTAEGRALVQRATTLTDVAPDLVAFLQRYPAPAPAGIDQCLYWSVMPTEKEPIVALHHLAVDRTRPAQAVVVDQTVYASRYFDTGAVVISLADAPNGGYYAIAGSRVVSAQFGRAAAVVLRRQIEKAALDSVRMYLGWMRDSLNS